MEAVTTAQLGKGVRVQRSPTDSPTEPADIGELIDISGPTMSKDAVEASHHLSPNRFREYISGLKDGGELSCTIALVPNTAELSAYKELHDDWKGDVTIAYRLIFPDGFNVWYFSAIMTSFEHAMPIDDRMTVAVTLKISGEPSFERIN